MSGSRRSLTNGRRAENVSTPFAPHPAAPSGSPPGMQLSGQAWASPPSVLVAHSVCAAYVFEWCSAEQEGASSLTLASVASLRRSP